MPIDLYMDPASSPCRAVIMTAQHIGVDMHLKSVNRKPGERLKAGSLKINPQHCVPTIDDNGFYLWESRAIQAYLCNQYSPDDPIYPRDPQKRAAVDRVLYFDIGILYEAEAGYLVPLLFKNEAPGHEKLEDFKHVLNLLEGFLSETAYVAANHLTVADFSVFASLTFAEAAGFSFAEYPKLSAWLLKLKSEIPNHEEINEKPLKHFMEYLKSKK